MGRLNLSGWIANLLGPLFLKVNGVEVDVPRRSTFNFVNIDVEDDPENECTNITASGEGGGELAVTGTGFVRATAGTIDGAASAVNLAGGSSHVTGVLPEANQADQTMGGDVSGATSAATVNKIKGTTVSTAGGSLPVGAVLRTTAAGTADWGTVDLADADARTGVLPLANQAVEPGTVQDIFGVDLKHFWGDGYDATTGGWPDSAGSADVDNGSDTIPQQGNINGHKSPFFTVNTDLLTGPDIATLDGLNSYIIFGCFRVDNGFGEGGLIAKGGTQFAIEFSNADIIVSVNGGSNGTLTSTSPIDDGRWHRCIVHVDAGAATLYVDGVAEDTDTFTAMPSGTTEGVIVGGSYIGPSPVLGSVTAVGIVTRAATALELTRLDRVLAQWIHGVDAKDIGNPLTDDEYVWKPRGSPGLAKYARNPKVTGSGTPDEEAFSIPLVDETTTRFVVNVQARGLASEFYAADLEAFFERTDGVSSVLVTPSVQNEQSNAGGATYTAELTLDGDDVKCLINGEAGTVWDLHVIRKETLLDATPAVFDPSSLDPTGWYENYTGVPWSPTPSAGTSGANGDLDEATNPPTASSGAADCDGTNDKLESPNNFTTFCTTGAGTILALVYLDTVPTDLGPTNRAGHPMLATTAVIGAYVGPNFSDSGFAGLAYDGGFQEAGPVPCSTGAWHLVMQRWDGATLEVSVDGDVAGAGYDSVACGTIATLNGIMRVGANHNATAFLDGKIKFYMTFDRAITNAELADIKSYTDTL